MPKDNHFHCGVQRSVSPYCSQTFGVVFINGSRGVLKLLQSMPRRSKTFAVLFTKLCLGFRIFSRCCLKNFALIFIRSVVLLIRFCCVVYKVLLCCSLTFAVIFSYYCHDFFLHFHFTNILCDVYRNFLLRQLL